MTFKSKNVIDASGKILPGMSLNPNGKAKNTPTKIYRTYNPQFKMEELQFDPIDEMVKIFRMLDNESMENICIKVDICKNLVQYIAPRMKAVEFSGNVNITHEQAIKALMFDVRDEKPANTNSLPATEVETG